MDDERIGHKKDILEFKNRVTRVKNAEIKFPPEGELVDFVCPNEGKIPSKIYVSISQNSKTLIIISAFIFCYVILLFSFIYSVQEELKTFIDVLRDIAKIAIS
jgi:hypothetical protein